MHYVTNSVVVMRNFTQPVMHILSLSVMVTLAVCLSNRTAESLVKSIKPNCSCGSSTTRSSPIVKFLQSSMGELVNVRWTVVMVKSIGAEIEEDGESLYQWWMSQAYAARHT